MHEGVSADAATASEQQPRDDAPTLDPRQPGLMVVAMIAALREHGLKVHLQNRPGSHALIRATQPAVPTEVFEAPVYTTPGLSQEVVLTRDTDPDTPAGGYAWYWLWGEEFRNSGKPELQKFANGTDVRNAADKVRRVLQVNNFM